MGGAHRDHPGRPPDEVDRDPAARPPGVVPGAVRHEALDRDPPVRGGARDEDLAVGRERGRRVALCGDAVRVDLARDPEGGVDGAVRVDRLEEDAVGSVLQESGEDDPPARLDERRVDGLVAVAGRELDEPVRAEARVGIAGAATASGTAIASAAAKPAADPRSHRLGRRSPYSSPDVIKPTKTIRGLAAPCICVRYRSVVGPPFQVRLGARPSRVQGRARGGWRLAGTLARSRWGSRRHGRGRRGRPGPGREPRQLARAALHARTGRVPGATLRRTRDICPARRRPPRANQRPRAGRRCPTSPGRANNPGPAEGIPVYDDLPADEDSGDVADAAERRQRRDGQTRSRDCPGGPASPAVSGESEGNVADRSRSTTRKPNCAGRARVTLRSGVILSPGGLVVCLDEDLTRSDRRGGRRGGRRRSRQCTEVTLAAGVFSLGGIPAANSSVHAARQVRTPTRRRPSKAS